MNQIAMKCCYVWMWNSDVICIYILENDKSKISKNKHEKCCLGEKEFSGEDTKEEHDKNICGDDKVDCKKQNNCNEEKCETHEIEKRVAAL